MIKIKRIKNTHDLEDALSMIYEDAYVFGLLKKDDLDRLRKVIGNIETETNIIVED